MAAIRVHVLPRRSPLISHPPMYGLDNKTGPIQIHAAIEPQKRSAQLITAASKNHNHHHQPQNRHRHPPKILPHPPENRTRISSHPPTLQISTTNSSRTPCSQLQAAPPSPCSPLMTSLNPPLHNLLQCHHQTPNETPQEQRNTWNNEQLSQ